MAVFSAAHFLNQGPPQERSFYFWKSHFKLDQKDLTNLKALKISKIYIRFFDVAWDRDMGAPKPVGPIHFSSPIPSSIPIQYVPTIFITNETLLETPPGGISPLVKKIVQKILFLKNHYRLPPFHELQMDCDWSSGSREKYFNFLREIKLETESQLTTRIILSATIRLHQIKYSQQTGIPPVDRGSLMFYNMTEVQDVKTMNSILNLKESERYLPKEGGQGKYPLPLDLALPLYSMGVLFQGHKFVGLINGLNRDELTAQSDFLPDSSSPGFFVAKQNTFLHGVHIYKNERIRLEEVSEEQLRTAVGIFKERIGSKVIGPAKALGPHPSKIVFFHFDKHLIRKIRLENLEYIYQLLL